MIRVLQIAGSLECGGFSTVLINYYRNIDRSKIQFDFLMYNGKKGYFEDEAIALGARIFRRPSRKENSIKYLQTLNHVLDENPDTRIIHIHENKYYATDLLLGIAKKIPVRIAHAHGLRINNQTLKKLMFKTATHLFACSPEAGRYMFGNNIADNDKFRLIKNAFDLDPFRYNVDIRTRLRSELGVMGKYVVLHVGRLAVVKNQGFLLKAFAEALKTQPNMVLLMAGDGDLREDLSSLATNLKINDKVQFLGMRDDVADLYQAADLHVLPSFSEGLGIVILEAQVSGLPCLVSDVVPHECKLTDSVEFLPIDKGFGIWAERMLAYQVFDRRDSLENVKMAGYDIKDATKILENFYLSCYAGGL